MISTVCLRYLIFTPYWLFNSSLINIIAGCWQLHYLSDSTTSILLWIKVRLKASAIIETHPGETLIYLQTEEHIVPISYQPINLLFIDFIIMTRFKQRRPIHGTIKTFFKKSWRIKFVSYICLYIDILYTIGSQIECTFRIADG